MKNGTSKNSLEKPRTETPTPLVDDTKHTVHHFMDLISAATLNGDEWVETTMEIIRHYNRNGLGKTAEGKPIRYFIFNGIKVCPIGEREAIEEEMNEQMGFKKHGKGEGTVISGGGF